MKILAIDDERMALLLLHDAIKEVVPDAELYSCRDAEDAMLYARSHSLDVAFLDINMGESNGISLAKYLKELYPKINIIFVTGYSEYMHSAIRLHASGYILKPVSADDVRRELDNLLNDIDSRPTGIYAHTFGNFDLFVDGKIVSFSLSKAKEMLAYLIDRGGSSVNRMELASVLFEDQPYSKQVQDYISKISRSLKASLDAVGAGDILVKGYNQYAVDTRRFDSDARAFLRGEAKAIQQFKREYMSQYSWAEDTLAVLEHKYDII